MDIIGISVEKITESIQDSARFLGVYGASENAVYECMKDLLEVIIDELQIDSYEGYDEYHAGRKDVACETMQKLKRAVEYFQIPNQE